MSRRTVLPELTVTGFSNAANPGKQIPKSIATRQAKQHRTDQYQMELVIMELASGEVVFQNSVEFKRAAAGKSYD